MFVFVINRGARSFYCPTSDFDPLGVSKNYNIKTSCNYEIINNLFLKKNDFNYDFIAILNHFVILNCVLLRREQRVHPYLLMVFSAIPSLLPSAVLFCC